MYLHTYNMAPRAAHIVEHVFSNHVPNKNPLGASRFRPTRSRLGGNRLSGPSTKVCPTLIHAHNPGCYVLTIIVCITSAYPPTCRDRRFFINSPRYGLDHSIPRPRMGVCFPNLSRLPTHVVFHSRLTFPRNHPWKPWLRTIIHPLPRPNLVYLGLYCIFCRPTSRAKLYYWR